VHEAGGCGKHPDPKQRKGIQPTNSLLTRFAPGETVIASQINKIQVLSQVFSPVRTNGNVVVSGIVFPEAQLPS
jgi:hypothetical protein